MYMKKKERELSIYFIPYASHFRCLSINVIDMLYVKLPMLITIIYIVHLNISALLVYLVPNTGLWSRQNPNDQFAWIPCNNIPCSLKRRSCDHRAKHEFVMQLNYSWIFNIYIYIYKSTKFNNHWNHGNKNNKVSISCGCNNHNASFMMASWNWNTFRIVRGIHRWNPLTNGQ